VADDVDLAIVAGMDLNAETESVRSNWLSAKAAVESARRAAAVRRRKLMVSFLSCKDCDAWSARNCNKRPYAGVGVVVPLIVLI
jgi:hypothetical protein